MVTEPVLVAVAPWLSVAVMVTEAVPADDGLPEMAPVVALIVRPAGRPEALKLRVSPASGSVKVPLGMVKV